MHGASNAATLARGVRSEVARPPDPPLDDAVYRHLIAIRDSRGLCAALQRAMEGRGAPPIESAQVIQHHYKPHARGRMVVLVQAAQADDRWLYLCIYPDAARAQDRHRRALAGSDGVPQPAAPILLPGWNGVGWWLPKVPRLRPVRCCFHRRRYRRFLSEHGLAAQPALPTLVRYVPRQRAVFRASPDLYIKFYRPAQDVQAAENLALVTQAWREGRLALRPPHLRFHDARRHAVGMDGVAGRCLTEVMCPAAPGLLGRVATALASLHASGIPAPLRWTSTGEIAALRAAMADMTQALPALGADIALLVDDIARRATNLDFETRATVHGNLFGDQILVDARHIGIVDWDDLAQGDDLYDIGRLIAHLIYVQADAGIAPPLTAGAIGELLEAYQRARGAPIDAARLRWHVAVALLMRAKISALRMLPARWIEQSVRAVAAAHAVLGGADPWLPGAP